MGDWVGVAAHAQARGRDKGVYQQI